MFDMAQLKTAREKWLDWEWEDDVEAKTNTGKLCEAIFDGGADDDECIELLEKGANPNAATMYVPTAFISVCENGHARLAKAMIEHGAFPDQRGSHEHTALTNAISNGHDDIATMLVEAGADVNTTGNCRFTALISAAAEGKDTLVRLLMEHGADPEYRAPAQYRGLNAEETAEHRGHETTAALIRELKSTCKPAVTLTQGAKYPDYDDAYYEEWHDAQLHVANMV